MTSKSSIQSRTALAAVSLLIAFTLIGSPAIVHTVAQNSENRELFVPIDKNKFDLTPSQEDLLAKIRSQSTTADTRVVKIRTDLLKAAPQGVKMNVRTGKQFEVVTTETRAINGGLSWIGKPDAPSDAAVLIIKDGNVTGTVRAGDELYAVRPIGGGLHVIIRQAQDRFPQEHPPEFERREREPQRENESLNTADVSDLPKTLRVLVAYTPKVAAAVPDVDSFINLAVAETNLSYTNSKIAIRAELAHAYKVNYQESGSHDTDVENFRNNSDSLMDEVHGLRDTYKADVCVLLIDDDAYCGLADAIMATENSAFAVVHHSCATGYYSFAHEIGHLQGARHNLEADGGAPFEYGHGYYNQAGKWRTIMSYNCPGGCTRLPYWSNPNITYNGAAMGTEGQQNNARVLNETAPVITTFRN
jgi:hypothetical protein